MDGHTLAASLHTCTHMPSHDHAHTCTPARLQACCHRSGVSATPFGTPFCTPRGSRGMECAHPCQCHATTAMLALASHAGLARKPLTQASHAELHAEPQVELIIQA